MIQSNENIDLLHHLIDRVIFLPFDTLTCNLSVFRGVHSKVNSREGSAPKAMRRYEIAVNTLL